MGGNVRILDNGKENGNYYIAYGGDIGIMEKKMETTGITGLHRGYMSVGLLRPARLPAQPSALTSQVAQRSSSSTTRRDMITTNVDISQDYFRGRVRAM